MSAALRPVCGTRVFAATDDDRPRTLLVSDLHIPPSGGPVLTAFLELLAVARAQAQRTRLLVLGDLLESLVNERQLQLGLWPDLLAALRATAAAGVSLTVLHGNRDFMLGRGFARAAQCRVVPGGLALRLGGRAMLALHGDELCTNDFGYQKVKRWLRGHLVRGLCRMMPLGVAGRVGRTARAKSGKTMAHGDADRFAPVVDAVREVFAAGYAGVIFGHVHTPARGTSGGGDYLILPAFDALPVYLHHDGGPAPRFVRLGAAPAGDEVEFGPVPFAAPRAPQ